MNAILAVLLVFFVAGNSQSPELPLPTPEAPEGSHARG